MELKKSEIQRLYVGLINCANLTGAKFVYAVNRNRKKLEPSIESLDKAREFSEAYQEFDDARIALCEEFADLDKDGKPKKVITNPITQSYQFVVNEKAVEFEKAFGKLKVSKKHKEAVEARDKQLKEVEDLLEEKEKVELHLVDLDKVPDEITSDQMAGIFEIIKE